MGFEGKDELLLKCSDIIDSLESDFLNYSKTLVKNSNKVVDDFKLEDAMSVIFYNITKDNYDLDKTRKLLHECFDSDNFINYLLHASSLHLLHKFTIALQMSHPELLKHSVYFGNALHKFLSSYMNSFEAVEEKENIKEEIKNNVKSYSGSAFNLFGNIIDELKRTHKLGNELELLNLYKGVNIKHNAKIVDITNDSMILNTNFMQILAIKDEGNAFIVAGDNLTSHVKADFVNINLSDNLITLKNFSRLKTMAALQRKHPRVYPKIITEATLRNSAGVEINGKLFDISQGGIGVVSTQDAEYVSGEELEAIFTLKMPKTEEEIKVNLKVNLVVSLNYRGSMRYCCQITKEQDINAKIIEFTKLREEQTLEELKHKAFVV